MSEEKILSSEHTEKQFSGSVIAGEEGASIPKHGTSVASTLKDRITASTEAKGLKKLPDSFDEHNGDWITINSTNPFEILYLDYKQYKFITPEIVKNNYTILEKFWKSKVEIMNTGGNRVQFKTKYGDGIVDNSLTKLKKAYEKINTERGIDEYYKDINNERLKKGEENLKESIEDMCVDGVADKDEIELRLKRGLNFDLSIDETASIIKQSLEKRNFQPWKTPTGNTLPEQLVSVECWLSEKKNSEKKAEEEEKKKRGREIFEDVFAYSTEDIGTILFNDEGQAKDYIKKNLIKEIVGYFSAPKANQILNIQETQKNEHLKYLQIAYRLNPKLPYKFENKLFQNVVELTTALFEKNKSGKEHLNQGNIEIWLGETDKKAFGEWIKIRDKAENIDLAFLEFIYSFNPKLPYRFADKILIHSTEELCREINKNTENWKNGKKELYNSAIIIWLSTTGNRSIVDKWDILKNKNKDNEDVGLEEFLHLLNEKTEYPKIEVDNKSVLFPRIQSKDTVTMDLLFSNKTRGYTEGTLTFSKTLEGVNISSEKIIFNSADGTNDSKIKLTINTENLLKGVLYNTDIILTTTAKQKFEIPVSFQVVFPKRAFILETLKYSVIVSAFFALTRWILSANTYKDWLNKYYTFYLDWNNSTEHFSDFGVFGWVFLFFITGISIGFYFLIKYLIVKKNSKDTILKVNKSTKQNTQDAVKTLNTNVDNSRKVVKNGKILFALNIDNKGNAVNQSDTFTMSTTGRQIYVYVDLYPNIFDSDKVLIYIYKLVNKEWKLIQDLSNDIKSDITSYYFPCNFLPNDEKFNYGTFRFRACIDIWENVIARGDVKIINP